MAIEIRETIVEPTAEGLSVQLHISDVPKGAEGATFQLILLAKMPRSETPVLAQLQRAALHRARQEMGTLWQALGAELNAAHYDLDLRPTR